MPSDCATASLRATNDKDASFAPISTTTMRVCGTGMRRNSAYIPAAIACPSIFMNK